MGWQSGGGVTPDATTTSKGIIELAGDLSGTAAAPTVPGKAALVHTHAESDVTSLVTDLASMVRNTLMTTKGDLLVATAANTPARLAVGSNGQVPYADSTQAQGVTWATPVAAASANVSSGNQSTTSSSITDLATPGPAVTVTVGPLGIAIVSLSFWGYVSGSGIAYMTYVTTGANSVGANQSIKNNSTIQETWTIVDVLTGLTPGSTTFTAKYQVAGGGSGNYDYRFIQVVTF